MRVIAIDPGAKGGIADMSSEGGCIILHSIKDMPSLDTERGLHDLMSWMQAAPCQVVMEVQRCRGGNAALATWNHARHYGKIEACLSLSFSTCKLIEPTTWMRKVKDVVGDPVVERLDASKARTWTLARQLFPDAILVGPRGRKKDGRADAICMGWYYLTHVA